MKYTTNATVAFPRGVCAFASKLLLIRRIEALSVSNLLRGDTTRCRSHPPKQTHPTLSQQGDNNRINKTRPRQRQCTTTVGEVRRGCSKANKSGTTTKPLPLFSLPCHHFFLLKPNDRSRPEKIYTYATPSQVVHCFLCLRGPRPFFPPSPSVPDPLNFFTLTLDIEAYTDVRRISYEV